MQKVNYMGIIKNFVNDRKDKKNAIEELGGEEKFKQLQGFFYNRMVCDYYDDPSRKKGFIDSLRSYRSVKRYLSSCAFVDALSLFGLGNKVCEMLSTSSCSVNDIAAVALTLGIAGFTTSRLPRLTKAMRNAQNNVVMYIKAHTHKGHEKIVHWVGENDESVDNNSFNNVHMSDKTANIAARGVVDNLQRYFNDKIDFDRQI